MNYMINMFSIPLIHVQIDEWEFKKKEIIKLFSSSNLKIDKLEKVKSDFSTKGKSYNGKVQKIFSNEIQTLAQFTEMKNLRVSNSWIESADRNMYHQIHNHGALGYSAVCFVDYDETHHFPTQFVSPFNNFLNGSILSYSPEQISEGSLLFFPSMIHHYTTPNESDIERTILSFNLSQ